MADADESGAVGRLSTERPLDHERLDVYRAAVELDALVIRACRRAPRGHSWLLEQIQRASGSMVLNIVEGNGRMGADRTHHFRIARGSALECAGAAGLMERRGMMSTLDQRTAHGLASRVVAMLTRLAR